MSKIDYLFLKVNINLADTK